MIGMFNRIFKSSRVQGRKINRIEALLALIATFAKYGKKRVSLGEFQIAAMDWQKNFPLGYTFSASFLYSYELFEDLGTLEYEGEVSELAYRHDGFLPKSFIELTEIGLLRGQQVWTQLSDEDRATLENAVNKAIEHYSRTWRLWSRPEPMSSLK
jgi:hypothetical protein